MKFLAEIDIMPQKEILDPQGKAVTGSLQKIGLGAIQNVRIGKHISLEIEVSNLEEASSKTEEACKKMLANLIMETYTVSIKQLD